jgi:DNA polymerase alpha subunit A
VFGKYQPSPDSEDTKSVMVEMRNVRRTLYVLPRGDAAADEQGRAAVRDEVLDALRQRLGPEPKFRTMWWVKAGAAGGLTSVRGREEKSYCFELPHIPRGKAMYLKVVYSMGLEKPYASGALEPLESGATFAHVFGANQSACEALILGQKLMGPSWIHVQAPVSIEHKRASWCTVRRVGRACWTHAPPLPRQFEAYFDFEQAGAKLSEVANRAPPTVSVLSLSLKTVVDPASHQHEICVATGVLAEQVSLTNLGAVAERKLKTAFCLVRAPPGGQIPAGLVPADHITAQASEGALLNCLVALLHTLDPDVLLGHNIEGFELDLLLARMKHLRVAHWSKIGRLNLSNFPKVHRVAGGRAAYYGVLTPGRLVLDTYKLAQELLLGQRDYSLNSLCVAKGLLPKERLDLDPLQVPACVSRVAGQG